MKKYKILFLVIIVIALASNITNMQGQTKGKKTGLGYAEASYTSLSDNDFMTNWMVLGPIKIEKSDIKPDENKQREAFDNDVITNVHVQSKKTLPKVKIGDSEYYWKPAKFENGIIDFNHSFGQNNYSITYALAEIMMETPAKILVGVGSDDGIKIFVNGKLIHNNWIPRPLSFDEDLVILDLKKGSNQILVKVQNIEIDWSLCMRKLGKDIMSKILIESSGKGDLDKVRTLVDNGVDVDAINDAGLTAYQNAKIRGRDKVMEYLVENGASIDFLMPPLDKLVNNVFKNIYTGSTPGAAVLISENGKIIFENCFGYADVGNKVLVTSNTKFKIADISKQFIAAAILKLEEDGKIDRKDKLSKFFPDFPKGDEVTIHHLLSHTSGIGEYTERPAFLKYASLPITSSAVIDTIKSLSFSFTPGNNYKYSNSGYFLLGQIIENVSGKPLKDYLKETFFIPLGMKNTGVYEANLLLENEAYGYTYQNGIINKAPNWDMTWLGGAGALYSTTKDLFTWNEALFNGKILSEDNFNDVFSPVVLNNQEMIDYGYGWVLQNHRDHKFMSYPGWMYGFYSNLMRQPENNANIIILGNSLPTLQGFDPMDKSLLISEYLFWQDMTKQPTFTSEILVDQNLLKSYVGNFKFNSGDILTISLEGRQLFAQVTNQAKYPIFPSSNNEFNWKITEASIRFIADENGKVNEAVLNQQGQQFEIERISEEISEKKD